MVLLRDLAVGQRLLQFGDARVGDLRAVAGERTQRGHSLVSAQLTLQTRLRRRVKEISGREPGDVLHQSKLSAVPVLRRM